MVKFEPQNLKSSNRTLGSCHLYKKALILIIFKVFQRQNQHLWLRNRHHILSRDHLHLHSIYYIILIKINNLLLKSSANVQQINSLKILRVMRVLRVIKLIRSLRYMKLILRVLTKEAENVCYVLCLLTLAIFLTGLIGMQMYGGKFDWQWSQQSLLV